MNPNPNEADAEQHRARMKAVQGEMRARINSAKERRGLLIVNTGDGKGKTTAAFGILARMLAHGRACAVVQFIKSADDAVERLLRGPLLRWHHVGDGFTWDTQDRAADIAGCRVGWDLATGYLQSPEIDCVVLDELNVVLAFDYLPREEVFAALRARRPDQHVIVTGRGAPPGLIDLADLVTEMREIKHPFQAGVRAQPGIEF